MERAAAKIAPNGLRGLALGCALAQLALGLFSAIYALLGQAPLAKGARLSELPERLSETGLFAPGGTAEVDPRNLFYVPQYPLWTDGAEKRRWVRLPEGSAIDARDPDAWQLPAGTRFWKEFSFGARVETRFIEVTAEGARFATYVWAADGSDAYRVRDGVELATARGAHEVPRESDCGACHDGRPGSILGFGALQLSPDRDPNAPHREPLRAGHVGLRELAARRLLQGLPEHLLREPPRVASSQPRERAVLGYLFGNCSGCHNARGPLASLGLDLDQRIGLGEASRALATALNVKSQFLVPGASETLRIAPGRADASAIAFRMSSRVPALQMPPLGTRRIDDEALALVRAFITHDLAEVSKQERK